MKNLLSLTLFLLISLVFNAQKADYLLNSYSNEELSLIEKIVYDWLFQVGAIQRGLLEGKPCIKLTPFGKKVFATR